MTCAPLCYFWLELSFQCIGLAANIMLWYFLWYMSKYLLRNVNYQLPCCLWML